jgi:hypothetical protein
MNKEMLAVLAKPTVRELMLNQGFVAKSSTPEALAAYMKEQLAVWKTALKAAGIEAHELRKRTPRLRRDDILTALTARYGRSPPGGCGSSPGDICGTSPAEAGGCSVCGFIVFVNWCCSVLNCCI